MRVLPRMGRIAWVLRSRACLALPPALSPSTMNSSVSPPPSPEEYASLPRGRRRRAAVSLARPARPLRAGRGLALDLALGLAAQALVHPLHHRAQQRLSALHV